MCTTQTDKQIVNIADVRKMDTWSESDLAHESFYKFLVANNIWCNCSSQFDFWNKSWNFYKQLSK